MLLKRVSTTSTTYRSFLNYFKSSQCALYSLNVNFSQPPFNLRKSADANVAIIGGGAVGVSIAYHLAKRGMNDVVLLEKSDLTAGSTWHAAGLATYFMSSINPKKINYYGLNLYKRLEEETGQNVSFHTPGSLRLLTTPERVNEAKYQMTRQHWHEAEQLFISKDEVLQMIPFANPETILGGIYTPGDGHIDPYSLTMAFAAGARNNGAEIYQQCPVQSIKILKDKRFAISTPNGELIAKHLVNAAGFWAHEIGDLLNIKFPIVPVHHQFAITSEIPEVAKLKNELPVVRDLEGSYYLRQEKNGLLVGPYEAMDRMKVCEDWVRQGVPKNFGRELFEPDLERIMPNLEMAMEMFPVLKTGEINSVVAGPITYNCENSPLLGPYQGIHNHWLAVGFGYGIAQAGGAGRFVADYIVDGEKPHELNDLDANRYGWWCTTDFAIEKARETYGLNNLLGYPFEERPVGRPTARCSPMYPLLQSRGAEFGFHNGWEQPHWFGLTDSEKGYQPSFFRTNWLSAVKRECHAVLNKVGITDLTPFSKYRVSGKGAAAFMDYMTANNLPKIEKCIVTHMLTNTGRVFSEITLSRIKEDEFFVITGSGVERHDLQWLEKHLVDCDVVEEDSVSIENISDEFANFGIAGPLARKLLSQLVDCNLDSSAFPFLACKQMSFTCWDGSLIDIQATRISYSGELGFELICKMGDCIKLYETLVKRGEQYDIVDFGSFAMNAMRIEKGFRMWGNDMNADTNPIEAGLGFFVRENKKSNFIGKEAIKAIKSQPLSRQLVHLVLPTTENVDPQGNESVWCGNEIVGNTTSGCFACQLNASLAMAYVRTSHLGMDNLSVELMGERYEAQVLLQPPFKTQAQREREAKS